MNISHGNRLDPLPIAAAARLAEIVAARLASAPVAALRGRHRGRQRVARARQLAMYLAHVGLGLSFTRVGICFGRDRTTVRHACALIEDGRDDPRAEFGLAAVETALAALSGLLLPEARR
jgi:chromosomal replication initiation ATPase DnaA